MALRVRRHAGDPARARLRASARARRREPVARARAGRRPRTDAGRSRPEPEPVAGRGASRSESRRRRRAPVAASPPPPLGRRRLAPEPAAAARAQAARPRTTRRGASVRAPATSTRRRHRRAATCGWPSARASLLGAIALACFAAGTVATMVIVCVVVLLATAEAYAAFRRAQYHPATLLGLVAVLSLMIETYNKGVAALPLVLVLLVAGSFVWYLARVEPAADPVVGHHLDGLRLRLGGRASARSPRCCSTRTCSPTATASPSSWPRSSSRWPTTWPRCWSARPWAATRWPRPSAPTRAGRA